MADSGDTVASKDINVQNTCAPTLHETANSGDDIDTPEIKEISGYGPSSKPLKGQCIRA